MVADADRREKHRITLVSVAAALVLTGLKLAAGLLSGSLGLLSEALHSGLDLVASVITYFSVRIAERPADPEHPYGHGRFENLSAIIQGLLLVGTASVIMYESVRRILFGSVEVEASVWAFGVMGVSIAVDLWRSRMLASAARRFHSRAMEADALNFRADMISSAVVILGLALVALGDRLGRTGILDRADAAAALVVALVIIGMSARLSLRAVRVLLDRAPASLSARMTAAATAVPGVVGSEPVRLRESGDRLLADVTVQVARTTSLAEAHAITEVVEATLRGVEPRTETVVHVEPTVDETETAAESIRAVAWRMGARTHHEQVVRVGDHQEASLHVEVGPDLSLREAHDLAHRLVAALKADNGRLRRVDTHIEVATPHAHTRREATRERPDIARAVAAVVREVEEEVVLHEVRLYGSAQPGLDAVVHMGFPPDLPMGEVHPRTEALEQLIRRRLPELESVVIHAEPVVPAPVVRRGE